MEAILHKSDSRGFADHGWLKARHTFSFGGYFDRSRMNFGALRVFNDDIIAPKMGFGKHPHDNMEIITIPISGTLAHKDSMGHEQVINPGEVQVMSAGTGIYHSEFNANDNEDANILQLWIMPEKQNVEPRYDQKFFDKEEAMGKWQFLVSPHHDGALKLNQSAVISRVFIQKDKVIDYLPEKKHFGNYLFVIEGQVDIEGHELDQRDGIGINNKGRIELKALEDSLILNIEVPDYK